MLGSGDVPPLIEDRLRAVCQRLPGAYEEPAWVGIRWRVRGRTFAHACTVASDHPTSHARIFATDGPISVVTFRAPAAEVGGLIGCGFPFYWPGWGTNVVGMLLDGQTDWSEVAELLTDSYCVQAPKKLARLLDRPPIRQRHRDSTLKTAASMDFAGSRRHASPEPWDAMLDGKEAQRVHDHYDSQFEDHAHAGIGHQTGQHTCAAG